MVTVFIVCVVVIYKYTRYLHHSSLYSVTTFGVLFLCCFVLALARVFARLFSEKPVVANDESDNDANNGDGAALETTECVRERDSGLCVRS